MNCPRCQYHSPFEQTRCPSCLTTFETDALEELGHLQFLHMQLRHWRTTGVLPPVGASTALNLTEQRITTVQTSLGLRLAPAPASRPQAAPPTQPAPAPSPEPVAEPITPTLPSAVVATPPTPTPPPVVTAAPPQTTPPPAPVEPATSTEPVTPVAPAIPPAPRQATPTPSAPPTARVEDAPRPHALTPSRPTPPRPAFSWSQVGTYLLSERTLNGLLSLGAFLILVSGTVISTINPTGLAPIPHFISTVVTTLLFYLAGLFVRQKLALPRTGSVLLAIGAAFIPLTIWTLGQRELLDWDRDAIWLTAALLCLPIYLGSHLLLRDRTFALLTAIAGGVEVFTILAWLDVPLEWRFCALILLAMRYLTLAVRLRERWPALAWGFTWTAQIATPVILAITLLGHILPASWTLATSIEPDDFFGVAVALAWWLGVAYYALAARRLPGRAYGYVAAWGLPVALLLTLSEVAIARLWHPVLLAESWHNLGFALLALAALAWGRWRENPLADEARPTLRTVFTQPAYQLALALPLVTILWPAQILESRVPTLFILAGLYALAAWLFHQLPFRAAAAYLLAVAIGYGLQLSVRPDALSWLYNWHGLVWALVAGGYLLFARYALRAGRADDGSYHYRGLAIEPVAHTILPLTAMVIITSPPATWGQVSAILALSVVYGAATFLFGQRAWAWPAIIFLAFAAFPLFRLLELDANERPLAWAILAVGLLVAAEIAVWRTAEERRALLATVLGQGDWRSRFAAPLFAVGYASGALALLLALERTTHARPAGFVWGYFLPTPVLATFFVLVAALVASAVTRRASRFLYAACALFLLPYTAANALIARELGIVLADHDAARLLALLGAAYLAIALATDRAGVRFAAPLWLSGYALILAMPIFAANNRLATVQTLGLAIILLAASALLAHFDRHPSLNALAGAFSPNATDVENQTFRALFLYGATWLFPSWVVLAMSLRAPAPAAADYGLALALLAPLYALLGAAFGSIRPAYRWPWYLCGYWLSAVGPFVALPDETLRIAALAISIGLWTATAIASRRAAWLYPVAIFAPVLAWEICARLDVDPSYSGLVLVALSLAYTIVGMALHRGWQQPFGRVIGLPGRYAWPFLGMGQVLVLLGMSLSVLATRELNVATYALMALSYVVLAWLFRLPVFVWPATAAATVAYVIGMSLPLSEEHFGLGLLPLLFVALVVADLLRRILDDNNPSEDTAENTALGIGGPLLAWATPGYALAYGGSAFVIALSWGEAVGILALAWWGVAALYALSTVLFRHPASLYPAIGTALAGIVATAHALVPSMSNAQLLALLIVPAWFLAVTADTIASLRNTGQDEIPARWPFLGAERLLTHEWAAPPLAFALGALILATVGSATEAGAGLAAALAGTILLDLFATRWRGEVEAWGALALTALSFWHLLDLRNVPLSEQSTPWALLALGLTLLTIGVRAVATTALDPWRRPLALGTIGYSAWALLLGLVQATDVSGQQSFAITLALTGLTLIAHSFDRRERRLGYVGVAFLEAGYMVNLFVLEVGQPQAFALPVGLYLLAVAYLEWRRGTGSSIKAALELSALSLLLSVSAIQSLGYLQAGVADRHYYGSFLLVETALLFALGAALRWRRTFLGSAIGIVAAVGILLSDPVKNLNNWYLAAIIGFIMIALVIFIEQRRQQIPVWLGEWRARLEEWD